MVFKPFLVYRMQAEKVRCRVKVWKLSRRDAWNLAGELAGMSVVRGQGEIFLEILAGKTTFLGARVMVRPWNEMMEEAKRWSRGAQ